MDTLQSEVLNLAEHGSLHVQACNGVVVTEHVDPALVGGLR